MINEDQVSYIAQLARLELTNEEVKKFSGQLKQILDHAQKVSAINLDDLEPTTHPMTLTNVYREDKVWESWPRDEVLSNAPDQEKGMFKVPRII